MTEQKDAKIVLQYSFSTTSYSCTKKILIIFILFFIYHTMCTFLCCYSFFSTLYFKHDFWYLTFPCFQLEDYQV